MFFVHNLVASSQANNVALWRKKKFSQLPYRKLCNNKLRSIPTKVLTKLNLHCCSPCKLADLTTFFDNFFKIWIQYTAYFTFDHCLNWLSLHVHSNYRCEFSVSLDTALRILVLTCGVNSTNISCTYITYQTVVNKKSSLHSLVYKTLKIICK